MLSSLQPRTALLETKSCILEAFLVVEGVLVLVAQSCLSLCSPNDCSPPHPSVHGTSQARILEGVAIPLSRGSSQSRDWTRVFCIAGRFFTVWATREARSNLRGHLVVAQSVFWISLKSCAWWDFERPLLYLWSLTRHLWWASPSWEALPRLSWEVSFAAMRSAGTWPAQQAVPCPEWGGTCWKAWGPGGKRIPRGFVGLGYGGRLNNRSTSSLSPCLSGNWGKTEGDIKFRWKRNLVSWVK